MPVPRVQHQEGYQVTSKKLLHAEGWNGNDYTLCGLAMEAADDPSTGETEPVVFARTGLQVTCEPCKQVIAHCQDRYTNNYRVRRR